MNPAPTNVPRSDYVVIVSNDGDEFYLERKIAFTSEILEGMIRRAPFDKGYRKIQLENIKGSVLEIVIQYLHYKSRYMLTDFERTPPPKFHIEPRLALDVLKASLSLKL